MSKIFANVILCMAITANAQTYNKVLAEAGDRIRTVYLASIAPNGGKVQKPPFIFDVEKEYCLCFSNNFLVELSILSNESTPKNTTEILKISLQCNDSILNKIEPEAASNLNKYLAENNFSSSKPYPLVLLD